MANLLNVTSFWSKLSLFGLACIPTGLFTLAFSVRPVTAAWNQFQVCHVELQQAGITPEKASQACASALRPKDLSLCVDQINYLTKLNAEDVLQSCFRVRRPLELANCVIEIHQDIQNTDPAKVMDFCRRSLLPSRFSECVTGVINDSPMGLDQALENCLKSE